MMHLWGSGALLLSCILFIGIGTLVMAEDEFFICGDREDLERTHILYCGETHFVPCVILEQNASNLTFTIKDNPILIDWEHHYYSWGTLKAGDAWLSEPYEGVQFNDLAPPGEYLLEISLEYRDDEDELVEKEFEYQLLLVQTLDVTRYVLYRGITYRIELEVETFVDLDWINVSFMYPNAGDDWRTTRMRAISPGVHTFKVDIEGDMYRDIDEMDYGYMIDAMIDDREIFLIDLYFNEPMEIVDEPQSFLLVILLVIALAVGGVMVGIHLSRRRKEIPEEKDEPPSC